MAQAADVDPRDAPVRQSQGLLDDVWGEDGRRVAWCSRGFPPLLHLNRSWDTWYGTLALTPGETRAFPPSSPLGPVATGYLVWRRSVFWVYLPMLVLALSLSIVQIFLLYNVPIESFLASYYSDTWDTLSLAKDQLHGPYYVSLARDIVLSLACFASCIWLGLALLNWDSFLRSARRLRVAFIFTFVAPFLTTALFSTNDAVDWSGVVNTICVETFKTQLGNIITVDTTSDTVQAQIEAIGNQLCDGIGHKSNFDSSQQTQANILSQLEQYGLLSNSTIGGYCPPPSFNSGADGRRRLVEKNAAPSFWRSWAAGRQLQEHDCPETFVGPHPFHQIFEAAANGCQNAVDLIVGSDQFENLLTAASNGDPRAIQLKNALLQRYPQLSSASIEDLVNRNQRGSGGSIPCSLRAQISSTGLISSVLRSSTSSLLTQGASAVTQSWSTILNLGPTVLGFALGVGRGTLLSKLLLPSSRLPAFFAAFAIFVGLPLVAAFAAFLVQLTGSTWLAASLISLLMALGVWLPLGMVRVDKLAKPPELGGGLWANTKSAANAYLDARKLRYPIKHGEASRLYYGRKYAYYIYITLCIVFFVMYITSSDTLASTMLDSCVSYFTRIGTQWGSALLALQSLFETFANMYIAQVAYCDGTVTLLGHAAAKDLTDSQEMVLAREVEFGHVAAMLATGVDSAAGAAKGEPRQRRLSARARVSNGQPSEYAGGELVQPAGGKADHI